VYELIFKVFKLHHERPRRTRYGNKVLHNVAFKEEVRIAALLRSGNR